jgi:histone H3/H4
MARTKMTQAQATALSRKGMAAAASAKKAPAAAAVKTPKASIAKKAPRAVQQLPPAAEPVVAAADEPVDAVEGAKKKRRWRPGTVALREIRYQQKNSDKKHVFPRASFNRLVREVCGELAASNTINTEDLRWQASAFEVLHEATETELLRMTNDALLNMVLARRKTLMAADWRRSVSSHNRFTNAGIHYPLKSQDGEQIMNVPDGATVAAKLKAPRKAVAKRNAGAAKVAPTKRAPKAAAVAVAIPEPDAAAAADAPADAAADAEPAADLEAGEVAAEADDAAF